MLFILPQVFLGGAAVPDRTVTGDPPGQRSALAAASRHLFGNPNPAATVQAWPMQHPELAVVSWVAAMLAVFAPLAVHLYRRKELG